MTRWNIRTVALYSHHGQRRDVNFEIGKVNIITGPSHTGKSAVAEVIDYCMGAGTCNLPSLWVREASSWVAVLWERGVDRFVVARRVPRQSEPVPSDLYFDKGSTLGSSLLPTSADRFGAVQSRDVVMRCVEEALGIGDVRGETLNPDRPGNRISARSVMPFLIQDDDVIISKSVLLRGMQDERRQTIIDTLPYFMRVTDETSAALESEARRLRKRLREEERRLGQLEDAVYAEQDRVFALVAEAAQLGLTRPLVDANDTVETALALLVATRDWRPGEPVTSGSSRLEQLRGSEEDFRHEASRLRKEIAGAERLLGAANGFATAVRDQERKLRHVELFSDTPENSECPICSSQVKPTETLGSLQAAHRALSRELTDVSRERPQIDVFLSERRDQLQEVERNLAAVRREIASIVRESDALSESAGQDFARSRVAGRISFYLDTRKEIESVSQTKLLELQRRVGELEESAGNEAKLERLESAQEQVAFSATEILSSLPLAEDYRPARAYFAARKVECGLVARQGRVPMRSVGSDENYLSLHLAMLFGLHRLFKQRQAPVPGVLLLDQVSRPYFPPEQHADEVVLDDTERSSVGRYFDFLFREVEAQMDLQVIVLEHAYLRSDARFVAATTRWSSTGEKLIPSDWPRAASDQS